MITWFTDFISISLVNLITPISLVIIGHLVEKVYVGRITIFANTIALNLFFHSVNVTEILGWYLNIGLIWGVIGLLAYFARKRLPNWYYKVGLIYSSIPVGAILLYFTLYPIAIT